MDTLAEIIARWIGAVAANGSLSGAAANACRKAIDEDAAFTARIIATLESEVAALRAEADRLRAELDEHAWWRSELADKLHVAEAELAAIKAAKPSGYLIEEVSSSGYSVGGAGGSGPVQTEWVSVPKDRGDPMENWLMKPALEWLEEAEHGAEQDRCRLIAGMLRDLWRNNDTMGEWRDIPVEEQA